MYVWATGRHVTVAIDWHSKGCFAGQRKRGKAASERFFVMTHTLVMNFRADRAPLLGGPTRSLTMLRWPQTGSSSV